MTNLQGKIAKLQGQLTRLANIAATLPDVPPSKRRILPSMREKLYYPISHKVTSSLEITLAYAPNHIEVKHILHGLEVTEDMYATSIPGVWYSPRLGKPIPFYDTPSDAYVASLHLDYISKLATMSKALDDLQSQIEADISEFPENQPLSPYVEAYLRVSQANPNRT